MAQFLKNFSLRFDPVFTREMQEIHGHDWPYGEIKLNDFREVFAMTEQVWSVANYLEQWKWAWNHLKSNTRAMFIVNLQISNRMMMVWPVYKIKNRLHIRNHMLMGKQFNKVFDDLRFSPKNSCFYVPYRKDYTLDGMKPLEWVVQPTEQERKMLNM